MKIEILKENNIDVERAFDYLNNSESYDEMLKSFKETNVFRLDKIKKHHSTDLSNYAIDCHDLKSDSRYLGFTELADIAYNHEIAAKESNANFIKSNYSELEKGIEKANELIDKYLNS